MKKMTSRDRVETTIRHVEPDRVPLFAHTMDPKFIIEFGDGDVLKALDYLELDCFPIRVQTWCQGMPLLWSLKQDVSKEDQTAGGVFGGWNGIDEFGRVWKRGSCVGGALRSWDDIEKYIPSLKLEERCPPEVMGRYRELYPDKIYSLNFHSGPFGLTMESMGLESFCYALYDDRELVREVIKRRTNWYIDVCKYIEELGADILVMGDDVGYKEKTFVSAQDFAELAIPAYRRIVDSLRIPVFWHSDGFIEPFIDLAVDAGITGLHAIEPGAGNDLSRIKEKYENQLVLLGNVDCSQVLTQPDLTLVRKEVDRCMKEGKEGGGYMIAESNSLHGGCDAGAVKEMYRYALEVGGY